MDNEIDNDALEILIASGIDIPTAIEASRIEPPKNEPPRKSGCFGVAVFVAVALVYRLLF
jgi:hypothetical protein